MDTADIDLDHHVPGALVCYRMFGSIAGLHPLDARTIPLHCDNQECLHTALAEWPGWLEDSPIHPKVAGLIPS